MANNSQNQPQTPKPGILNQGKAEVKEDEQKSPSAQSTTDNDRMAIMEQTVATLTAQLRAISNQTQTNTGNLSVLDRRADLFEERAFDAEIFALWGGLRTEIKNQMESDRLFPPRTADGQITDKRYRVGLLGQIKGGDQSPLPQYGRADKTPKEPQRTPTGVPDVDLWANSPEEVKGRYMQLFSINGVYHTVSWNIREISPAATDVPLIATDQERNQITKLQDLLTERVTKTGKSRPPWDLTPNRQYAALVATAMMG